MAVDGLQAWELATWKEKIMETLELTINPGYVRNWGTWEAVRELVQNCVDAHDIGHEMCIMYDPESETLTLDNDGATMGRNALILGGSTKEDDHRQRGKFGEGFKLAWVVLLRGGMTVTCRTDMEAWAPRIGHSEKYDSEILFVDVTQNESGFTGISVSVGGISQDDWNDISGRLLFLREPDDGEAVSVGSGRILTGQQYRGSLYSRGIFVARLPGKYWFGYDLNEVGLDRDRNLADPWSLQYSVKESLSEALTSGGIPAKDIYILLGSNDEWAEAGVVAGATYYANDMTATMAKMFAAEYGPDAVPVGTTTESIEVDQLGMRGVVVNKHLKKIIEHQTGALSVISAKKSFGIRLRLGLSDLTEPEVKNLEWVANVIPEKFDIIVVEFYGDKVRGALDLDDGKPSVQLARKMLRDRAELVSAVVYELSRQHGEPGELGHVLAIGEMFGLIVAEVAQ